MTQFTPSQARQMLSDACKQYLAHNASQLRKIHGVINYGYLINKPGPWRICTYERLLNNIYDLECFSDTHMGLPTSFKHIRANYDFFNVEEELFELYYFGQLKGLGTDIPNGVVTKILDCSKNVLFLHNILIVNRLLYHMLTHRKASNTEYSLCVKTDASVIEKNKLYLSLRKNSDKIAMHRGSFDNDKQVAVPDYTLEYTFLNYAGEINTATMDLNSIFFSDFKAQAEFLSKPLSEESLLMLESSIHLILEITSKRGHTHNDEELMRQLREYRVQHDQLNEYSEQIPLGWYKVLMESFECVDSSTIGNGSQWSSISQYRVMPPINTAERPISREEYQHCVHLPYIESKQNSLLPISVQINATLSNLRSLVDFMGTLPKYSTGRYKKEFSRLRASFDEAHPTFEGYIKRLAVQELKDTLDNRSLSDEEAVKAFEAQLKSHPDTMRILTKNRQSQCEQTLKLLSVISIVIGVGIFTTLGLAFKRLYDSKGTSINFFKPLSQNLTEDIESITANIAPTK